jgi:hypothetical protein
MPFQRTPKEKAESKKLKAAIQTFNDVIADPDASLRQKSDARREEKKTRSALEALETRIAERKLKYVQDEYLEAAQERFPEIATKASPNRETILSELRSYLNSLDSGPECLRAHQYIGNLIHGFENQIKTEQNEAREAERKAKDRQEQLDFVACEKAKKEIADKTRPFFITPRSFPWRQRMQELLLKDAAKWKEIAKTRGDGIDETGARQSAIAIAYAEAFEFAAKRIAVFEYDLEWQPSDDQLAKMKWLFELPIEENWAFRSSSSKPSEEQALLRVALLRWRQKLGYQTDDIPVVPFPTKVPRSVGSSPATREFSEIRQEDRRRQLEEQRIARIEKMRVENPTAFKNLTAEHLKPIEVDLPPILYWVQRKTLDQPNLSDVLYWPSGERAVVGKDVHYDFRSKQYFLEDIAVEWLGPSQRAQQTEEELERQNQLSAAEALAPFHEHIIRKPRPTIAAKPIEKSSTPFYRQPLRLIQGDHMPDESDPRHPKNGGRFSWGSWYSKEQCEQADKQAALYGLHIFDGISRHDPVVTLAAKPENKLRDSAVWSAHEVKIKQNEGEQ